MKNTILAFFVALFIVFGISCTDNNMARNYGGTEEIQIPEGQTLINMTWKEANLWVLTEDSSYYYFQEHSSWGVWEGTIKVKK